MMRNLYIVRGLPGSGKSTFAKFVGDSFVEADMFFMKNGKYEFDMSKIRDAHSWCLSTVREWMQMSLLLIFTSNQQDQSTLSVLPSLPPELVLLLKK